MVRFGLVFLCLCLCLSVPSMAGEGAPAFFSALPDVPLMQGLIEIQDQGLEYDKPQGRVIESVAEMRGVSPDMVDAFYRASLPQFGWIRLDVHKFMRGGESLVFSFEENDGHDFVRIMLTPR